jgi:ribonuclease-3
MGLWGRVKNLFGREEATPVDLSKADLERVQTIIGYTFRDITLLVLALTHRSFSHLHEICEPSNERLEYLGDSVLGLIIADQLYRDHPKIMEGDLTKIKSLLVNEGALAETAIEVGLNEYLRLSPEEDRAGGRLRPSIVSDAFESIIGAVYLDGGLDCARDIVMRLLYSRREELTSNASSRNYKGELLEAVQARAHGIPRYEVLSESGPDHDKIFEVAVFINGQKAGTGTGSSKKEAEQRAAAVALDDLRAEPN